MIKTFHSTLVTIYSLANNKILTMPAPFIVSQFFAFSLFSACLVYLFIWVRGYQML
jgi:hypothetical protein